MFVFRLLLETTIIPVPEAISLVIAFIELSLMVQYIEAEKYFLAFLVLVFAGFLSESVVFLYTVVHKWTLMGKFVPGTHPMWYCQVFLIPFCLYIDDF